jgi:hypothetical protein
VIAPGEAASRFLELAMYRQRPMTKQLSAWDLEYAILQIYSKASGPHEAKIGFHIGPGHSRTSASAMQSTCLFNCQPSGEGRVSYQRTKTVHRRWRRL